MVEKAWAKVKGSYFAAEGGFIENGLRALSGVPVVKYETSEITSKAEAHEFWKVLKDADSKGYYIGAGTRGENNE